MAAKRVVSEERKFISLLASKLKKENYEFGGAELASLFGEALSNLPDSHLKSGLMKSHHTHLKKLKSLLTSKKSQQESVVVKSSKSNFYNEQDIEEVIGKIKASKSIRERDDLFNRLWSCYPVLKDSHKIFSSLEVANGIAAIEKCIQKTVGCFNKKNILECLSFLLRVFSAECEACFNDTISSKCNSIASSMQTSIIVMNHRWLSCANLVSTIHNSGTPLLQDESFEDLMAALLSLYTDLVLLNHESNDDSALQQLASLVFMVIGHSPKHCMDAMLQLTKPNGKLFPLLSCILNRNKGQMDYKHYIKFVCLARLALKYSSSQDKTLSILKITKNQAPPHGFVALLLKSNKSLVEKLKITKKMSPSQLNTLLVSDYLCEDDVESLLDISMENPSKETSAEVNQETEEPQNDETGDNQLFFIDSIGGVEEAEDHEVEIDENKNRDALLRRQIKTIIREAEEESDSEGDVFDELLTSVTKDLNKQASTEETEET